MPNCAAENANASVTAAGRAARVAAIVLLAAVAAAAGRWSARRLMRALRPPGAGHVDRRRSATFDPTDMAGPMEWGEGSDAPGVPRPRDAHRRLCQRSSRTGAMILLYESADPPSAVAAYYRSVMPGVGWAEETRRSHLATRAYAGILRSGLANQPNDGILLFFRKGLKRKCIISVSESADAGRTMTTVMVR